MATTTTINKLDQVRDTLFKTRFDNELTSLKQPPPELQDDSSDSDSDKEDTQTRIKHLQQIVQRLDQEAKDRQGKDFIEQVNEAVYQKPWNRLPIFHKIVKWKEYMAANTQIKSKKQKKALIQQGVDLLTNKKLTTKKYVIYDPSKAQITEVPAMVYNEEDKTWKIKA